MTGQAARRCLAVLMTCDAATHGRYTGAPNHNVHGGYVPMAVATLRTRLQMDTVTPIDPVGDLAHCDPRNLLLEFRVPS